ncbi:response regulator [Jiella pelagia]|uniref:Response regulator n=1 Tax=Jiella pelagia TaxID=2986949 RepID=A0ABY7C348_9HYPH|nr:response regulator [Jiella pelagia]WAP70151.1 response regulator [Jiella pelagia]
MDKAAGSLKGRRVLLVEDDYFIAEEMNRTFRDMGVEVVGPVATVGEALRLIESGHLDGAVLDINLQGELAFAVADLLLERCVPFVFATGYDQSVIPARFASAIRCEKPVSPVALARALALR